MRRAGERPLIRLNAPEGSRHITLERLAPGEHGTQLEANIHTVKPGAENDGVIRHDGDELGFVLEGGAELVVGEERSYLQAGDSFVFPS